MSNKSIGQATGAAAGFLANALKSFIKGFVKGAFKLDVDSWDTGTIDDLLQRSSEELAQANKALMEVLNGNPEDSAEHQIAKHLILANNEVNSELPAFGESIKAGQQDQFLIGLNNRQGLEGTNSFVENAAENDYKVFVEDSLSNPERKRELMEVFQSCYSETGNPVIGAIKEKQIVEVLSNLEDIANVIDPKSPASKDDKIVSRIDIERKELNQTNINIAEKAIKERYKQKEKESSDPNADSIYANDSEEPSGP